jgi:DNA mismatch endonuclease (patch repair protein)
LDRVSPQTRSQVMSKVKSRGNKSTEWRLRAALIRAGIRGWTMNSNLPGKPDFVFEAARLAVFVDGCFWHGCPKCKKMPTSNAAYWTAKIEKNRERDRQTNSTLRRLGWKVIRIWEHEMINLASAATKIAEGTFNPF